MADFLLELLSEEIPARMQAKARADLERLFAEQLAKSGLAATSVETYATPRRLALVARGLPLETQPVREERKGPSAAAPLPAIEGFLRATGLTRDQLVEREDKKGVTLFAVVEKPGRAAVDVLTEAIPAIVRAFPWPKSMRWGAASLSTESPRWVRPLQGIVALLGDAIVPFEIAGVTAGAATVGHRFHHPGIVTIGNADDYATKLRACHVIVDPDERARIIREGAERAAVAAGLVLVPDEGLVAENAGLTEWPVPLLGCFDPAFLQVPPEVIQLTMRTNQKYFVLNSSPSSLGEGDHPPQADGGGVAPLAPAFICTANIEASDGGAAIVAGNERVLSARLSDAKFFWEQDLKGPLEDQAKKLNQIVFHEKLGTIADKVERVAKLARWLVEEGIVKPSPTWGEGGARSAQPSGRVRGSEPCPSAADAAGPSPRSSPSRGEEVVRLAAQAETAARLCKADLVTGMVGEFPELQGLIGGYLARAQGQPNAIADAIRDHYKPVGQGDDVPTAPVTVAVSLADKLDSIFGFFHVGLEPTGSKDPFALRRQALGIIALVTNNDLRLRLADVFSRQSFVWNLTAHITATAQTGTEPIDRVRKALGQVAATGDLMAEVRPLLDFFADRLKVQQREAGVRHDLIDAVFALGGEDDLVRLLARVKALQSFVETPEGADLLAGYKRAANILRKEGWSAAPSRHPGLDPGSTSSSDRKDRWMPDQVRHDDARAVQIPLSYPPQKEEAELITALDLAEPRAAAAIETEDFEGAMAALASLRAPVDAFFDNVIVNDPFKAKREFRLALLARIRDAVHRVADFSRIEG